MKTIKKAQTGGKLIDKPMPKSPKTPPTPPSKPMMKAKSGKSFPDLNKDGKITKADILKGRGVIAQNGKKMQGVKGMSENEKLKKGITRLAPVNGKPVKKAQDGYTGEPGFAERGGPMRKTKVKERSTDGNYVTKTVTRERKGAKNVSSKTRRSFQGFLTGAPTVKEMKSGGKMKKCKGGC